MRTRSRAPLWIASATVAVTAGVLLVLVVQARPGGRPVACLPFKLRQAALSAAAHGTSSAGRVPDFSHVVVIVMENKECSQVVGSSDAPYLNALGRRYALLRNLYATGHPSFPNYLAMTAGSRLGTTVDATCATCQYPQRNIVDQLEAARMSWKAYMEGMPSPCYGPTRAGSYAKRHNPFLFFSDISGDPARCANVVPLSQLGDDLRARRLPRFSWITPDLCDDMHNCPVAPGDRFLARTVPALLRALGPRGAIFITWDEGTTKRGCCRLASGGNIPGVIAGGAVRSGARPTTAYDAYSILRTIEDGWRLARLRNAACPCTPSITDVWRRQALPH
jgi:phospholipase C